jgi:DNA processing protein
VESAEDVLRVLAALPGVAEVAEEETAGRAYREPRASGRADIPPVADEEALHTILDALLSPTPTPINILARDAGAPVAAVLAALTELALAGRVELAPGNMAIKL